MSDERPIVKYINVASLLLALWLTGCATTPPEVASYVDPMTGLRTDLITDNLLGEQPRDMLWLNASRVFTSESGYVYYLEVNYAAAPDTGYIEIDPGESLVILADNKEMKFKGNGSAGLRTKKSGVLRENAIYPVQAGQLRALAAAGHVTVRVIGKNGLIQRDFSQQNSQRFQEFVSKFVPAPAAK